MKIKKFLIFSVLIILLMSGCSMTKDSMEDINDENLEWGMDYTQFHAPHIRLTQDHEIRISEHDERIAKLEETVAKQEDIIKQQAEIIKLLQTQLGMTNSEGE